MTYLFRQPFKLTIYPTSYDPKTDVPEPKPLGWKKEIVGIEGLFIRSVSMKVKSKQRTNLEHIKIEFQERKLFKWKDVSVDVARIISVSAPTIQNALGESYDRYKFKPNSNLFGKFEGSILPSMPFPKGGEIYFIIGFAVPGVKLNSKKTLFLGFQESMGGDKVNEAHCKFVFVNRTMHPD